MLKRDWLKVGWLGYPDEKIRSLSKMFLEKGFDAFKVKVGTDIEDDKRRLRFKKNFQDKTKDVFKLQKNDILSDLEYY